MTGRIDARLTELGLTLPSAAPPVATYVPFVRTGDLIHISGQIARGVDGTPTTGVLGAGTSVEEGATAAATCALALIAQMKAACGGDLDRVVQVVKLNGFVASAPGFGDQPKVVNGASDLMVAVFGDAGKHARSAVGVAALPLGVSVEIDAVVQVR
jgi:enamine deaminase RidA (YjgF/YER057c/UK114 family)